MSDDMRLTPESFEIIDHGPDHAQYFQGCGVAFTRYARCYTGAGFSGKEALSDALDQMAMDGWNVEAIEASEEAKEVCGNPKTIDDWHECSTEEERERCEHYWYVSIRFN